MQVTEKLVIFSRILFEFCVDVHFLNFGWYPTIISTTFNIPTYFIELNIYFIKLRSIIMFKTHTLTSYRVLFDK